MIKQCQHDFMYLKNMSFALYLPPPEVCRLPSVVLPMKFQSLLSVNNMTREKGVSEGEQP